MEQSLEFKYFKYNLFEDIPQEDKALIAEAQKATAHSYAPFSKFRVGAAARLQSGETLSGANVESEVFPAGICAERNLLFSIVATHPTAIIEAIAIASAPSPQECYPCGVCRQTLLDVERKQGSPIRIIMSGESSASVVESAELLLPFSFKL